MVLVAFASTRCAPPDARKNPDSPTFSPTTANLHIDNRNHNTSFVAFDVCSILLYAAEKMASLLGGAYDSSDDDTTTSKPQSATPATKIVAAPEVNTEVWSPGPFSLFFNIFSERVYILRQWYLTTHRIKHTCR